MIRKEHEESHLIRGYSPAPTEFLVREPQEKLVLKMDMKSHLYNQISKQKNRCLKQHLFFYPHFHSQEREISSSR